MNSSCNFVLLINIKNKRWNLGLTLCPPTLNKIRNLSPCHFADLPPFPPCQLTTILPFIPFQLTTLPHFPGHYPPTFPWSPPSQGTSREKLHKELGLETPRRWLKKLCCFYKIKNNGIPSYLAELIPSEFHLYNTRNTRNITTYSCRTDAFKYSFFPWTINEWNKLNFSIRASSFNIFRANLIKIIRPIPNSVFGIFNPLGLKLITRLWLGLSHLNEHRFKHNFNDCINPLCTCGLDIESTVHYFLHCNYYNSARISLLNDLNSVYISIKFIRLIFR